MAGVPFLYHGTHGASPNAFYRWGQWRDDCRAAIRFVDCAGGGLGGRAAVAARVRWRAAEHPVHHERRSRLPGRERVWIAVESRRRISIASPTEGMRFDRCYVTNSICGPSRACILTGKYSHKNGFYDNLHGRSTAASRRFPSCCRRPATRRRSSASGISRAIRPASIIGRSCRTRESTIGPTSSPRAARPPSPAT